MGGFRPSGRSTSRQIRLWGQRLSHVGAASERAIQGPGLPEIIEAGPDRRQLLLPVLLPHRRMLPNSSRLLIDAHRPDVNRSLLTIGPTAFG